MQHGLLGLALALIAAIVAALAAPLFVDWNAWRPEFEQRASALLGTPVTIKGPIEASILPTPAFVMRDVTVGDAERGTGLKAGQIRGVISLGALFRGAVEAEEIVLTKPSMRLALGVDRRVLLKQVPGEPGPFSVSRFTIEGGTLTVDDRANEKQFQFNDVAGTGELQSRTGPAKLDASFTEDGKPRNNTWKLRASTGQFGDGSGKLRVSLARVDGLAFDADGALALKDALPRFEGKINLSQPGALPWKLSANAAASNLAVKLDGLTVSFGAAEAPAEFSGQARVEPLKRGMLDAELSATFVDLDRATGAETQTVVAALAPLKELLASFEGQPLTGKVKLSIAQLVAGGGNVRDLSGVFSLRDGAFAPERLEARLPGRGSINVSGAPLPGGNFKGRWVLTADEPAALAAWTGIFPSDAAGSGTFNVDGGLLLSDGRLTLDPFLLALGETKLGGDLVYEWGAAPRVTARLNGTAVDVALLAPLVRKMLARDNPVEISASLDVLTPRIFDQSARRLNAAFSRKGSVVVLDRLAIEDMGGLNVSARGEIASFLDRPKGAVEFTLDANSPAGLNNLAAAFADPEIAAYLLRVSAAAMPLQIKGTIKGDGTSPAVAVEAAGKANDTQVTFVSRGDPRAFAIDDTRLVLEAADASGLVALLGLPAPEAQAGQGRFDLAVGKKEKDSAPLKARLTFPGIDLSGEGALRIAESGTLEPRVNLKLDATDFRALSIATARASGAVVPLNGTARLTLASSGIALEDLALNSGDMRLRGRVALKGVEAPALSGEIAVNRSELPMLLALGLGRAVEGAPWSDAPLGVAPLEGMSGDFSVESAALGLGGNLTATGARMKYRFGGDRLSIDDLSADLAGGKLKAHARISRPDFVSLDGGFSLEGADISRLISPANWRSVVHGKGNVTFDFAGQGASPAQLAGKYRGPGENTH